MEQIFMNRDQSFESFCEYIYNRIKERIVKYIGRDYLEAIELSYTKGVFYFPRYGVIYLLTPYANIPMSEIELVAVKKEVQLYQNRWRMTILNGEVQKFTEDLENSLFLMTIDSCHRIWGG